MTSVAAPAVPLWGDGLPDLVAVAGGDVLGSDDASTFAVLPGLLAGPGPWSAAAWVGVPARSLLVAGPGTAEFVQPAVNTGVSSSSGLASAMLALAPADQSVAYLLGADGAIVRTLSAGRQPATARVDKARIRAGATTRLNARIRIAAPGDLLVQSRVPGKPWQTEQTIAWTPADWDTTRSWSFSPSLTHDYALSFRYGGTTVPLTAATRVVVVPKVLTARSRYDLRRGAIFRFRARSPLA